MTKFNICFILIVEILLILILEVKVHAHDCFYDDTKKPMKYIYEDCIGKHFIQDITVVLYCNNYTLCIIKDEVQSISFRNCLKSDLYKSKLNLDQFTKLRAINISYFGFKNLPGNIFFYDTHLEQIIATHNAI